MSDTIRAILRGLMRSPADEIADSAGMLARHADMPVRQMELKFDNLPPVVKRGTVPEGQYADLVTQSLARQPFVRQGLDALDVPDATSAPDFSLDSPLFNQMYKADRAYDNLLRGRSANLRHQPYNAPAGAALRDAAADAIRSMARDAQSEQLARMAALAGAGGLGAMMATSDSNLRGPAEGAAAADEPVAPEAAPLDTSYEPPVLGVPGSTTADLAAESRPLPPTPTVEEQLPVMTAEEAAAHFSQEARNQIELLNQYRRQGQITPDNDRQMMSEINHLLALANEARNSR